jgi:LssY C-terminus
MLLSSSPSARLDPAEHRPLWLGAATFDRGVGVSHYTGQVTHHVDADVDAERDLLLRDLEKSGRLVRGYRVPGFGRPTHGRNGGCDRYFTDGMVAVAVLAPEEVAEKR